MTSRILTAVITAAAIGGATGLSASRGQDAPPVGVPPGGTQASDEDFEVYNRGPLHEAFATPGTNEPVRGRTVRQAPPEPIEEVPPEQRPQGANIVWIPGYWDFDEELDDFLWISGVWRDVPPGRTWVPGYWTEAGDHFQWVAGMWADADVEQVSYLPEPPESQERGPVSPSPGEGYFWAPGDWRYVNNDYRWHPGYWAPHQRDWIWVPACYNDTPRGYVYVPGYWDYLVAYRGVAFAPVYFHNHAYRRPFAPSVALDTWGNLMLHLFVQPRYGRYYFGDYYGRQFADYGFTPFYAHHRNYGYDPLFVYFSWRFGNDYYNRLDGWHRYFAANDEFRPRRTFREQREFVERNRDNRVVAATNLSASLQDVAQSRDLPVAFARVSGEERERFTHQTRELREFTRERVQVEARPEGRTQPDVGQRELRIQGDERLRLHADDGRLEARPRVEAPDRPDQLRDVPPDSPDGDRARVPSPHTRDPRQDRPQPEAREREQPDVRERPAPRERPNVRPGPEPGGRRDLPRLPDGPSAPEGERGQPDRGAGSPEREPPRGQQQPDRGGRRQQGSPGRDASDRGQRGPDRGERSDGGAPPQERSGDGRSEDRPQRGEPE